jgi:hypothetical protein
MTAYLLVLAYNARMIIDILANFLLGRKQEDGSRAKSWMTIVGYAIGTILFLLLIRSAAIQGVIGVIESAVTATSSALKIGQGLPPQLGSSAPSPYLIYYILLVFAAIALVSFTLLFGAVGAAYRLAREEQVSVKANDVRREALQVVQRAARGLRSTDDYRETILNCYREMCRVLALRGFQTECHETASEFSTSVSYKLGLGGDCVRSLTLLFEEARYSDHRIDNTKRTVALNQLESLEQSLGSGSI